MTDSGNADSAPSGRDIDRLEIGLNITGADLDPERITRMLGVNPTFAARMGEQMDIEGVPMVQRTGIWSYALPASPEWELGDAIDTLLEALPADPALWESLAGRAAAAVVCALYVHGVDRAGTLSPDTLARLAERRLALRLEIHGPATE